MFLTCVAATMAVWTLYRVRHSPGLSSQISKDEHQSRLDSLPGGVQVAVHTQVSSQNHRTIQTSPATKQTRESNDPEKSAQITEPLLSPQ